MKTINRTRRQWHGQHQWRRISLAMGIVLLACGGIKVPGAPAAPVHGWLNWRGPEQNGVSRETGLPDQIAVRGSNQVWSADFPGKSTPVIANGRLYVMGYLGEGPDLQEGIACFDAETGEKLWQQLFNDYLSDTIYLRYATSSPALDPETGMVYMQGTQGLLAAFTAEGKPVWHHDMMESFGRLTFPNSRTASPVVDRDLVITRGITANWGAQGVGADRFYAFDKKTGELVWASSPGDRPKDNSFSHPYLTWLEGRRVFLAATGDGSVVCVNARTGDPLWRVNLFKAGINASVLVHNNDKVIAVYGTPYELGQMVALRIPHVAPTNASDGPLILERASLELWSNEVSSSTSSPILVGDRIYMVAEKGDLCAVDVQTGKVLWKLRLGIEQRNACLLYAEGKLYVPLLDDPAAKSEKNSEAGAKGAFYIVQPTETEGRILAHAELEGRCFGTPTAYNGKVYIQTASKLYCFGRRGSQGDRLAEPAESPWPVAGPATQLQVIPSEALLKPGGAVHLRVRSLDAHGFTVEERVDPQAITWASYLPPTARVRSTMKAKVNAEGLLAADPDPVPSAGAFQAEFRGLKGTMRGRVLPGLPIREDFESFKLDNSTTNSIEPPTQFAYPPLSWIGARVKFEVRDKDGTKALTKTIDNRFFQRAFVFVGDPDLRNYTMQADVMSEGNRRKMSDVGLINQRYLIVLKGNEQKLEINSNLERLRVPASGTPPNFNWLPNSWYRLKARVEVGSDGVGLVRAKAWKRDDPEPEAWNLEVTHRTAHQNGAPGLFGFSPQDMRVYIDNVLVTPN